MAPEPPQQRLAKHLDIPIVATTQNAARLGDTVKEIVSQLPEKHLLHDKTLFSMLTPTVQEALQPNTSVIIVGIETHICVTQTTLDALAAGHKVYVLADGVSSCNKEERGIALDRLRAEGAVVTSSESIM
ncbi:Isochorismatase family protein 1B [Cyphellophora attinorum]|uniref:Isochorismatase family protein 1B n=1 Tax=Cyphellophora attinorum TaxID=1664694 RepID=A0A0N1HH98_9EURO|nr:Isochorismatase family protein 1B [Phialophora attinorum]KPI35085.1 Isochorismatase family protein 1B [Phialophora attinorum]